MFPPLLIPTLLAGIEGVESVVQEFFSENGLPVVRSEIPGVKVVFFYFLLVLFSGWEVQYP